MFIKVVKHKNSDLHNDEVSKSDYVVIKRD